MTSRYSFGGDEHIFVECDEEMSLEAFFKSLSVTKAAKAAESRASPRSVPPTPRSRSSSIPTLSNPTTFSPKSRRSKRRPARGYPKLEDPHHRDPGALQRSLDPRDPDALSRAAPGARLTDIEYTARDQQFRRGRGLHRGAFGRALVCFDGRIRGRSALPLSDGRARAADRGAEISSPAHRHAEAHHRPRRLFQLHLFGARRGRLSDVRHHADADLRSHQEISYLRDFMGLFSPGDMVKWRPISAAYTMLVADVDAGTSRRGWRRDFSLNDFHADIDGYNAKLTRALHGH